MTKSPVKVLMISLPLAKVLLAWQTHFSEEERREEHANLDIIHPLPLVDQQGLVGVHEPGEVLQPLQPDGDGGDLEQEPAEEHERDEEGRTHGQGNVNTGGSTGDEVAWRGERLLTII